MAAPEAIHQTNKNVRAGPPPGAQGEPDLLVEITGSRLFMLLSTNFSCFF